MPAEPEYEKSLFEIEEALKTVLRDFAEWCGKSWQMSENDRKEGDFTEDYLRGWNAGVLAVDGALDCYLDEHR